MAGVLDEEISSGDLEKFEKIYHEQLKEGRVTPRSEFEYAWCLVRSRYRADIRRGVVLLESLYKHGEDDAKRDYLYYLAVGNAKLKEFSLALKYIRALLSVEPGNLQATELESAISKRMNKEGLLGMAVAGSAVAVIAAASVIGGIVGITRAVMRK